MGHIRASSARSEDMFVLLTEIQFPATSVPWFFRCILPSSNPTSQRDASQVTNREVYQVCLYHSQLFIKPTLWLLQSLEVIRREVLSCLRLSDRLSVRDLSTARTIFHLCRSAGRRAALELHPSRSKTGLLPKGRILIHSRNGGRCITHATSTHIVGADLHRL